MCVLCGCENKQRLFPYTGLTGWFLSAFEKLRKRLSASSRLSVRPYGTTWLKLDGFSLNFIFATFQKSVEKIQVSLDLTRITITLNKDLRTLMIFCYIRLRMRNISDKSCRENETTHFTFNNLFLKIVPFMR